MQSLETISCWVLWQCGNHFSATELQNCHFPSLSPTIDGDGGHWPGLERKKKKSEIWEICAGMAQNYHFPSLCRNPRGRGHLVSANQGELSLGLVALLTTMDKKGKFRNVQTWEITTSENLNRNTFAPATIPPALKRSLANIHTHVLACADKN